MSIVYVKNTEKVIIIQLMAVDKCIQGGSVQFIHLFYSVSQKSTPPPKRLALASANLHHVAHN